MKLSRDRRRRLRSRGDARRRVFPLRGRDRARWSARAAARPSGSATRSRRSSSRRRPSPARCGSRSWRRGERAHRRTAEGPLKGDPAARHGGSRKGEADERHVQLPRAGRRGASARSGEAIRRGLFGRCPACGSGRLVSRLSEARPTCAVCGEDLQHRARRRRAGLSDDAGRLPYCRRRRAAVRGRLAALADVRSTRSSGLLAPWSSPCFLCRAMKGAVVGHQWALRMHGFGGPEK